MIQSDAPYFILPDIEALSDCDNADARQRLLRRIAINVGDAAARERIEGLSEADAALFATDTRLDRPSTEDAIESFLSRFGMSGEASGDADALSVAPAVDYLTLLALEEKQARDTEEEAEKNVQYAKMLIKNGDYQAAYQIIEELNLKNPEKSIYFADQMRFLRKLILLKEKTGK